MRSLAMLEALQKRKAEEAAAANVKEYWEAVGTREPYWGVLTSPEYKGQQQLEPPREETFFASGAAEVAFMESALRTHAGVELSALGAGDDAAFLDLGCGVGRIAIPMAQHCSHIFCVDIADSYLQQLRQACSSRSVSNFSAVRLDALLAASFPSSAASSDGRARSVRFAYSLITLQHNPPAVMLHLVGRLCDLLAPGGYALVHAPYHIPDHVTKDFPDVMQMNFVPKELVVQRVSASGCELVHILDEGVDYCGGDIENCCYLVRKPLAPASAALAACAEEAEAAEVS